MKTCLHLHHCLTELLTGRPAVLLGHGEALGLHHGLHRPSVNYQSLKKIFSSSENVSPTDNGLVWCLALSLLEVGALLPLLCPALSLVLLPALLLPPGLADLLRHGDALPLGPRLALLLLLLPAGGLSLHPTFLGALGLRHTVRGQRNPGLLHLQQINIRGAVTVTGPYSSM